MAIKSETLRMENKETLKAIKTKTLITIKKIISIPFPNKIPATLNKFNSIAGMEETKRRKRANL